jgi:hypothetical protein
MQVYTMRIGLTVLLAASAITLLNISATAQGFGGGQMPPEIQAKIKLWRKYSEEHKKATNLGQTVRKVEGMNKEDDFKLDKKQSGKMLSIMKTWSTKPTMSEDEAGTVTKEINSFLTIKQIKKMTTMPNGFGRPGGGGGPGGGGAGGGGGARPGGGAGGPGGAPGRMNFPDPPKTGINPFNPNAMSGMFKDMMKKSLDDFRTQLESQAH